MARILGISGSPNADGSTAYSVRYALGLVKERHGTEYLSLSGLDIHSCVGMRVVNDGVPYSHAGATIVAEAEKDALGKEAIEGMMRNLEKALPGSRIAPGARQCGV
jgi:hypothetical protein